MPTLYRQYRPQVFADLIGQEHIAQTIKNEISQNKLAQAYLFSGPRGVGKTTLARLLAKAINCEKRAAATSEPCGECSACTAIAAGRFIDVLEIDAASHTGVENVRENIIESAHFQPATAKYKVFIIDEVHMLSGSAFNALLKTLEEPPAHVIFILATTELHKLPATVISRCQRFQFKKIPHDLMLERLKKICAEEKIKVDKEVLERIIKKSDGCLRDAESLLGQIFTLDQKKITAADAELILPAGASDGVLEFTEFLLTRQMSAAFQLLARLISEGLSLDQFTLDLLEALRTVLFAKIGLTGSDLSPDFSPEHIKRLGKLATASALNDIQNLIDLTIKRRGQIKSAPLPELPLELLIVEFASSASLPTTPPPSSASTPASKPAAPESKHSLTESLKSALQTITGHREPPKTTLEEIQTKWSNLITLITKANHSLTFILSMASLNKVDADGLHLALPYSLHKEKLEDRKNRILIEQTLEAEFGEKIPLVCSLTAPPPAAPTADSELQSLALEFGGEVVS
ncbi:MAG: DNA polymerase III subunit gamma/tau [Candidatus Magasanikbacteria bacterium]|nr:DNA polymerase III subunit gamma/tau [Candidatus Magasanikbacteria bacterium]